MSDAFWQAFMTGIVALVSTIGTLILAFLSQRTSNAVNAASADRKAESDAAISKTEEVKATLQKSTSVMGTKLGEIHVLVNSGMERQLRVAAIALRRCAEQSRAANDPRADADEQAASEAELLLNEHLKKQALVDSGKPIG